MRLKTLQLKEFLQKFKKQNLKTLFTCIRVLFPSFLQQTKVLVKEKKMIQFSFLFFLYCWSKFLYVHPDGVSYWNSTLKGVYYYYYCMFDFLSFFCFVFFFKKKTFNSGKFSSIKMSRGKQEKKKLFFLRIEKRGCEKNENGFSSRAPEETKTLYVIF